MSKILSDEDGDTIWNDPTPSITNIDDEVLSKVSQHWLKIIEGIADTKGGQEALDQYFTNKIKEAELRGRIDELNDMLKDFSDYEPANGELDIATTLTNRLTQLTNQYKGDDNE